MQKMSFDLSQWESKMLEMNQNLATDISDRFFNSIKQFIGSKNLNNSLESKFQFIEKEFKSFLSNEIGSKVAELGAASLDKNQKLSVLVSTEFEKATMAGTENHATTKNLNCWSRRLLIWKQGKRNWRESFLVIKVYHTIKYYI